MTEIALTALILGLGLLYILEYTVQRIMKNITSLGLQVDSVRSATTRIQDPYLLITIGFRSNRDGSIMFGHRCWKRSEILLNMKRTQAMIKDHHLYDDFVILNTINLESDKEIHLDPRLI